MQKNNMLWLATRALIPALALSLGLAWTCLGQDAPPPPVDSLSDFAQGKGTLKPAARIAAKDLDECSGIAWYDGAWWAHNDSGDGPYLFRATSADFTDAQKLAVPGAKAVDWEDICTIGDDLLCCDIGDNARRRESVTLYRVHYSVGADGKGALKLLATYPVTWPDEPHDCEAAAVIDGKLHLVTKQRGEGFTGLYRFAELKDGAKNVPELVSRLNVGAGTMITAADYDAASGNLLLLGYTRIFVYPKGKLEGDPAWSTLIEADQCEALCLKAGTLFFTNEQRDVYWVHDFMTRKPQSMLPPRVTTTLPFEQSSFEVDGTGAAWKAGATILPMRNLNQGESLRWIIAGSRLMLYGSLGYEGSFTSSSERGNRMGTGLWLGFGSEGTEALAGTEKLFFIGDNGVTGADLWTVHMEKSIKLGLVEGVVCKGKPEAGKFTFEISLPVTAVFAEGKLPQGFLANAWGYGMRGEAEPNLAGSSFYSMLRPYTWADVTIKQ